jgi:hypothetical protein
LWSQLLAAVVSCQRLLWRAPALVRCSASFWASQVCKQRVPRCGGAPCAACCQCSASCVLATLVLHSALLLGIFWPAHCTSDRACELSLLVISRRSSPSLCSAAMGFQLSSSQHFQASREAAQLATADGSRRRGVEKLKGPGGWPRLSVPPLQTGGSRREPRALLGLELLLPQLTDRRGVDCSIGGGQKVANGKRPKVANAKTPRGMSLTDMHQPCSSPGMHDADNGLHACVRMRLTCLLYLVMCICAQVFVCPGSHLQHFAMMWHL